MHIKFLSFQAVTYFIFLLHTILSLPIPYPFLSLLKVVYIQM